jgi:hypothetical protein
VGAHQRDPNSISAMTLGELFLEAMSTGVITNGEMAWVTARQNQFSRTEEAVAQRLGRMIDEGTIQLGCRMPLA